jgi:phospholipid transport system substrate-binding protein
MRRYLTMIAALALVLFGAEPVLAQGLDASTPDGMIKSINADLMKDPSVDRQDIMGITAVVDQRFLPCIDLNRLTRLTMGRSWLVPTPAQRAQIIDLFAPLVTRAYVAVLAQAPEKIDYKPLRAPPDATEVTVHSQFVGHNQVTPVNYHLVRTSSGWRVYDFQISGSSLVAGYQHLFADPIARGGIDGLIRFLTTRNRELTTGR